MGKKMYRFGDELFDNLEDATAFARARLDCPTPDQRARLEQIKDGTYHKHPPSQNLPEEFSLRGKMPPVYDQGTRGTCVANAATALAEYFNDNKWRFSVQFLFEMMKQRELEARNRAAAELRDGREPSDPAMARRARDIAAHLARLQARSAKGVSKGVTPGDVAAAMMGMEIRRDGSLLHRAFEVLATKGICTEKFWPYSRTQIERCSLVDGLETSSLPPGAEDNAKKHVIAPGLFYLLRASNNIEELKRIIAGFGGKRPMPVCAGIDVFGTLAVSNGVVEMPALAEAEIYEEEYEARFTDSSMTRYVLGDPVPGTLAVAATVTAFCGSGGGHEIVLVGYRDDPSLPGGGAFEMRNSWDETWGDGGYAWLPYAYVEMFCDEAGTIVQSMEDYAGDAYGGADLPGAKGGVPDELKPFIKFAATDMKNSRGKWTISKGTKVIADADGIAEPDNEQNRLRFIALGFSWSGAPKAEAAPSSGAAQCAAPAQPDKGTFFASLEAAFKGASIPFPLLGGVKKPGLFAHAPKIEDFKAVADLSAQLGAGDALAIYEARDAKRCFRIAAAFLASQANAGEKAERVRKIVAEYNDARMFNPCQCTISVIASNGDILAAVAPYASESDVRIVAGRRDAASGWRCRAPAGVKGDSWPDWVARLVPNTPAQWSAQLENAWREISAEGGHVTFEKMAAATGLAEDVVGAFAGRFMRGYAVKGDRIARL